VKLANLAGRAVIVTHEGDSAAAIDVAIASNGRFGPDVQTIYDEWLAFTEWTAGTTLPAGAAFDETQLRAPVPAPRQVFAIGINYQRHADEAGRTPPPIPATFTKFPACINGPFGQVRLPSDAVDWEVELVVVIGRRAEAVGEADAWSCVAGLTVGQDLSERKVQMAAGAQFSLGKSYAGFAPMGPWVVSLDEVDDPNDLALGCSVDGEVMQNSRTGDLIFSVPRLIAELSAVLPLLPGDVIFTGTPEGVGAARQPPVFLRPGQVLETWIDGIGRMRNEMVGR
jgi:2,4-didehydro-3-deoxy-L-rhamnonate hydrolase